jgi:hypothetical protein
VEFKSILKDKQGDLFVKWLAKHAMASFDIDFVISRVP